jgi:hypothetical protein
MQRNRLRASVVSRCNVCNEFISITSHQMPPKPNYEASYHRCISAVLGGGQTCPAIVEWCHCGGWQPTTVWLIGPFNNKHFIYTGPCLSSSFSAVLGGGQTCPAIVEWCHCGGWQPTTVWLIGPFNNKHFIYTGPCLSSSFSAFPPPTRGLYSTAAQDSGWASRHLLVLALKKFYS